MLPPPVPVHEALAAVMAEVTHVGKTGKNTHQGYNFRGIDGVLNAVGPALRNHGVLVMPELLSYEAAQVEVGSKRTLQREVTVQVKYLFVGPAGDSLAVVVPGEAMDSGDKATSKAMSVAMRTALIQALALPTDEPDPDESSFERAPAQTASKAASKPAQSPKSVESEALAAARAVAHKLGDSAGTVVPSIIEEVTGRKAKLADLSDEELAAVTAELEKIGATA